MLNLLRTEPLGSINSRKVAVLGVLVLGLGSWISASMAMALKPYTALGQEEMQRQPSGAQINLEAIYGPDSSNSDYTTLPTDITVEGFLRSQMGFEQFVIASLELTIQMGLPITVVLITVMVGVEFSTGAIDTQLVFTPRRLSLLWAKALAPTIYGVCLVAIWAAAIMLLGVFSYLSVRGIEGLIASSLPGAQAGCALSVGAVMGMLAALVTMALASAAKAWALISAALVLSQSLELFKDAAQTAWLLSTTNIFSLINGDWSRTIYNDEGVRQGTIPHIDYGYSLGHVVFRLVVFEI